MGATVKAIADYRDSLKIGATLVLPNNEKAMLVKKYPNLCETNKGIFKWNEIYFKNTFMGEEESQE